MTTVRNIIQRKAVGINGRVGSFYDGLRESILDQGEVNSNKSSPQSSITCKIIRGDADRSHNIIKMLNIEQDLGIRFLLGVLPKMGMISLLDYRYPFNQYTRLLYYKYVHRFEEMDAPTEMPTIPDFRNKDDTPTHMITGVKWGMEVVIVLGLPSDTEMIKTIDEKLTMMQALLETKTTNAAFSLDDEELFNKHVQTQVYSNIPSLDKIDSFFTICQYLNGRSDLLNVYRPLMYQLQPIKELYPEYIGKEIDLSPFRSQLMNALEDHLIQFINQRKKTNLFLDFIKDNEQLKRQSDKIRQKLTDLNTVYERTATQFQNLIKSIRCKEIGISELDKAVERYIQWIQQNDLKSLSEEARELEAKRKVINELCQQHFQYYDAMMFNIKENDYVQILSEKLMKNPSDDRILCTSDALRLKNPTRWEILRDQLIKEHQQNSNLNLIYADFTYCSFALPTITLLPYGQRRDAAIGTRGKASSSLKDDAVNILLVGESGVGKSTFVNAFVNYLAFDTLETAKQRERLVLIPVSFVMITGDNFDEKRVHFGTSDNFNNEDFDHPGESVTQHCRSYVFPLNHLAGTKLRIIDTPGFGDTRGVEQDEINMQDILRYASNLTHLNAVCFLLKSNSAQVNKYLSVCLTQLLDLLGPGGHENIIFCFTNARASFYTPGETGSLLKKMLQSFSIPNIPFRKENTFCFDNESFRYLVALQNDIEFKNDAQKREYENSWVISLKESYRLVNYVTNELQTYVFDSQRPSKSMARMQIDKMVRPMLETMRNNLRHIILTDAKVKYQSIELLPKPIHRPASKCHDCSDQKPWQVGKFLTVADDPHEMLKSCLRCKCDSRQHIPSNYILEYNLSEKHPNYNREPMEKMKEELLQYSAEFAYVLTHIASLETADPFLMGLTNMITEENRLHGIQPPNTFNLKLAEMLTRLLDQYYNIREKLKSDGRNIDMAYVCQKIKKLREYSEIQVQMTVTEESQRLWVKVYEVMVPEDLMK